jgi:hypothetical protein
MLEVERMLNSLIGKLVSKIAAVLGHFWLLPTAFLL